MKKEKKKAEKAEKKKEEKPAEPEELDETELALAAEPKSKDPFEALPKGWVGGESLILRHYLLVFRHMFRSMLNISVNTF